MRVFNLLLNAAFAVSLTLAVFTAFAGSGAYSSPSAKPQEPPGAATPQSPPAPDAEAPQVPAVQPVSAPVPVPATPASATHGRGTPPKGAKGKKAVAKDLFGAVKAPANLAAKSIGFYAHGCLAGGKPLPVNGPAWQVMRLSRNRNWGHPSLIKYIERFAADAKEKDGWPGLLVGDLSMPRGGPMPYGHASHQVGLDVDIWYRPAPHHELSAKEREDIPMQSFLIDPGHVNPAMWSPDYVKLLRRAVSYPEVARIFVNPAIKKWLCDNVKSDRAFLAKITPIMGHDDHFHVRLVCPPGNPGCEGQAIKTDEGCGKGLDNWIAALMKSKPQPQSAAMVSAPVPAPAAAPKRWTFKAWKKKKIAAKGRTPLTMAQLPAECETVLKAPPAPVTAAR